MNGQFISLLLHIMKIYCFKRKQLIFMLEISDFFSSGDMADKMVASLENYSEMYKRSYLLNGSTDVHIICGKMFATLTPFY